MLVVQHSQLLNRGRSRGVPRSARARKASEERIITTTTNNITSTTSHHSSSFPSSSTDMITIVSPVPVKAAYPPAFIASPSPSPPSSASMSPDYYDSPPSPPRSLEDQVHVAYALDDIHRAKVLLLRLKGIEVTSDDDPRIAEVQDEDFDFCFVPNGRLLDENDEKVVLELQARELARMEENRRMDRLRTCERKWEEEKKRLRDERMAVLKRRERKQKEEEERRRRAEEYERQRTQEEEYRRLREEQPCQERGAERRVRSRTRNDRKLSYAGLPRHTASAPPVSEQKFVYDFMLPVPTSTRQPRKPDSTPPFTLRSHLQVPPFDETRTIPFIDVFRSMQGPLFPIVPEEHLPRADSPITSRSRSRNPSQLRNRKELELLEALLTVIESDDDERRKRKGKQSIRHRPVLPCLACNSSSVLSSPPSPLSPTPPTSASSSLPRTPSWLSFRGTATPSSASSSTTDLTSLSSSPIPSPRSSGWFSGKPKSWASHSHSLDSVLASSSTPSLSLTLSNPFPRPAPLRHSCQHRTRLTPVPPSEYPLPLPLDSPPPSKTSLEPISYQGRIRSTSTVRAAKEGAGLLVRRMSKIVEIAKGFQTAYVNVALFAAGGAYDVEHRSNRNDRSATRVNGADPIMSASPAGKIRPAGYRASAADVSVFLDPARVRYNTVLGPAPSAADDSSASDRVSNSLPRYIPLTSPFPPTSPPQTVLPDPLPYKLHFKPVPSPIRSPFRLQASSELHTMYPQSPSESTGQLGQMSWRIRSVGNPVYLRLKALRNIMWRSNQGWEGVAREMALGGGRERIVGVAYEGVGRSALSRIAPANS
ncbi:hypothetical protein CVT24_005294 [Panaeolus cyanescens]|uniref:Uncharacterized protein n=1 Tax=Panaeolus cyanescens TaxID=181874 RepID=A0A409Y9H9_9AGAR|nr:hypothetical protein CVT24_005294 [Panaeolus cyanescens]